jgi:peptidoglycan endopeptidase LytE
MTRVYKAAWRSLAVLAVTAMAFSVAMPAASAHHFDDFQRERHHIKERSRSALGTPYRSGGTSRSGFDCSGFTRWTFMEHGAALPHSAQEQFDLAKREGVVRIWKRSKLKLGDLVFHHTTSAQVGHAGIYIGHGKFISSTSSGGVSIESLYDPYYWGPRWVGATRVPATMEHHRRDA